MIVLRYRIKSFNRFILWVNLPVLGGLGAGLVAPRLPTQNACFLINYPWVL